MTESLKARYQRPEGALLEKAMKGPRKISGRQLGEMVGLSEGRIRQIVNGYRTEAGTVIETNAPVDTLTRLAEALGITAEEMEAAGRPDVASELRAKPRVGLTEDGDLWISDNSLEIEALSEWIHAADPNTSPPIEALALWEHHELLEGAARKHREELRLLNIIIQTTPRRGGDGDAEESRGSAPTRTGGDGVSADEREAIERERQQYEIRLQQEAANRGRSKGRAQREQQDKDAEAGGA